MRRKLLRAARAAARTADASAGAPTDDAPSQRAEAAAEVDALLDWLEAQRYLSPARFVDARLHARTPRFGNRRIEHELAQHGLALDAETLRHLRDSELARARAVRQRKFGAEPATEPAERARQMRFLAGRGFSAEVVRRAVGKNDSDDDA